MPTSATGSLWRDAHPRRTTRLFVAVVVASLVSLTGTTAAQAHATLTSATPSPGSVTEGAPHQVVLYFGRPPVRDELTTVSVVAPSGRQLSVGDAAAVDLAVGQRVSRSTETGWYSVRYQVLFFDGHATSGDFRFQVVATHGDADPGRWLWILVLLSATGVLVVFALARRAGVTASS